MSAQTSAKPGSLLADLPDFSITFPNGARIWKSLCTKRDRKAFPAGYTGAMMEIVQWTGLFGGIDAWQFAMIVTAALLVGFSKTGIGGVVMIVVPLLAAVFGGKASTGILLPMLIIGDVFAVAYYRRHGDWAGIRRLLPWTIAGLIAGILVGNLIDDQLFVLLIAVSVLACLCILVVLETRGSRVNPPDGTWFYALIGLIAGFCTMIGNVAGPIFAVYLLARRYDKQSFLGTSAWFFMVINVIKLPLQIFFWKNIGVQTLLMSATMIPAILVGAVIGVAVVRRVPEKPFRWLVIGMTFVAVIRLLV